jgi:hypothetical protein
MSTNSTVYQMAMQVEHQGLDRRAGRGWLAAQAATHQEHTHRIDRVSQTARHWFGRLAWRGNVNPAQDRALRRSW